MTSLSETGISKLLLREDWIFLQQQLDRQPQKDREDIKREYRARFIAAYETEPIPHRKANAARRAANLWLLSHFGPITKASGWIQMPVSPADIAQAKTRHRKNQEQHGKGKGIAEYAQWEGQLGEIILDRWLATAGTDYTWHNAESETFGPDFTVNEIPVDVKCTGRKTAPKNHWTIGVEEKKAKPSNRQFFFSIYVRNPGNELWLIGGIPSKTFMQLATFDAEGEQKHSAFEIRKGGSMYNIQITIPPSPQMWLESINGKGERS